MSNIDHGNAAATGLRQPMGQGWSLRRNALALALLGCALAPQVQAQQVQRILLNPAFEAPALQTVGCRVYIAQSQVPGWSTTHPPFATQQVGGCVVPPGFAQTAPIIEIWRAPRDNASGGMVNARVGNQFAELNAELASRIFQSVCLVNGEQVSWRFSHRGRASGSVHDQMEMKLGATSAVVRVGTTNNGNFLAPTALQGTVQPPTNAPGNTTWVDYTGSFTHAGATGVTNIGFEALGGTTAGNFLDHIQVSMVPFIEFTQTSSSTPESATLNVPTLRVNGELPNAVMVTVEIVGGTATIGEDYTTPGNSTTITIAVPAGTYDGMSPASLFPLPVTVIDDAEVEGNETIEFEIQAPGGTQPPFIVASSTTCGGPPQDHWTYTIIDDDGGLVLDKNIAQVQPVAGDPTLFDLTYTVVVNNPTGVAVNYDLVDSPGFGANVSINTASFTLNGGAPAALAGAGPWTLQPQWRSLAPGATDTYSLNLRIQIARGGSAADNSCGSGPGSGLYNNAVATLQGTGGNPPQQFEEDACADTPAPVWVELRKVLQGRAIATDQAQVRLAVGGILSATATTSGTGLPATASTGVRVIRPGSTIEIEESIKTNGTGADRAPSDYRVSLTCSNATGDSSTALPSGPGTQLGTRQVWPDIGPVSGDDIDCVITNALQSADLTITKTNNADSVAAGEETVYEITVANAGPDAADGAVLTDPAVPGLECTAITCAASAGAACPASLSVAQLQGAGLAIPSLPNGGELVFSLTCTVTATGQP